MSLSNDPGQHGQPPPVPGVQGSFHNPQTPAHYRPGAQQSSIASILSMIFGIIGWMACGLFTAIPAVICGHFGLSETARNPNIQGRGMAIAGLILGYLHIAGTLAFVGFFIIFFSIVGWDTLTENSYSVDLFPEFPEEAEFSLILPEGHEPSEPIAAAIWLHGYGRNSSELAIFEEDYQQMADDLRIAFIGISATSKMDEGSYQWIEEHRGDHDYLTAVLDYHSDEITIDWPNVALFGFSQGAKVAGDLASHYPAKFRGAILMSPGGQKDDDVPTISTQGNANQYYVCVVGADEAYGNVSMTRTYARKLKRLGAEVFLKEYEGVEEHSTPPDYYERLPEWLGRILRAEAAEEPAISPGR